MRTLIVKGVVTAACLFVPTEVFANDHASQGKPENTPAKEQSASEKGEEVSAEAKANGNTHSQKSDPQKSKENPNPVVDDRRPDHVDQGQSPDKRDSSATKPDTDPSNKSEQTPNSPKENKGVKQRDDKVATDPKGTEVHKARDGNSLKSKPSAPDQVQETNKVADMVKPQKDVEQVDEKAVKTKQPVKQGNSQPLPSDQTRKDAPVVMPSNPTTQLFKTTGNGDGHSTSSGNGLTLYGLLLLGEGPLVTLEGDFLMEYRRAHNQWTNAPPSPPPKLNLLSQTV